jgi:hypothetical protein
VPIFVGPRPVFDALAWIGNEVADADAAFQIAQQRGWNAITGHPLVEGYDRLANLGVAEVRVTVRLVAIPPAWYRRFINRVRGLEDEVRYRLHVPGDGPPSITFRATVARNEKGAWSSKLESAHRARSTAVRAE